MLGHVILNIFIHNDNPMKILKLICSVVESTNDTLLYFQFPKVCGSRVWRHNSLSTIVFYLANNTHLFSFTISMLNLLTLCVKNLNYYSMNSYTVIRRVYPIHLTQCSDVTRKRSECI